MDGISEASRLSESINGWLTGNEGELLYELAKGCTGRGVIVEIGSWKGKSTVWLAVGSKAGKKIGVYAIDPHTGSSEHKDILGKSSTFKEFKENVKRAKVDDVVTPIVKKSEDAAADFNKPVELLFIDGDHSYDSVLADFTAWFPKLIDGGIIAFHDTIGWEGPMRVVEEKIYKSRYFRNVGFIDSITYGEKVHKNSAKDKCKNICQTAE